MDRHRIVTRLALASLSVVVGLGMGRLFTGGGWLLPVLGAAVLPHLIGAACDRFRVPTPLLFVVSLLAMFLFTAWVVAAHTTVVGVPTGRTFSSLAQALSDGGDLLRTGVPPVPATAVILSIAVPVMWVVAMNADFLAARADTPLGALVFPLLLLVVVAVFDRGRGSLVLAAAFALAAVLYLQAAGSERLERRRAWLHTPKTAGRWRFAVGGVVIGVIAITAGVVIGPFAPGADGRRVADLRGLGQGPDQSGDLNTDNPLVGLKGQLEQNPVVEVFTVRADRPQYWRLSALDRFDGEEWSLDAQALTGAPALDDLRRGVDPMRPRLRQTFRIDRLTGRFVPAAYQPVAVAGVPGLSVARGLGTLLRRDDGDTPITYTVDSLLAPHPSELTPLQRLGADAPVPRSMRDLTDLPSDFPDAVAALAREKTAAGRDRIEKAQALEDWFARSGDFTYSLSTASGTGHSAIETFVIDDRRGFCEQFAAAYAAMARSVGIPARVVVGFTPGARDASGTGFSVRSRDAHAWAEVWISPQVGWVTMEPTPAGTLPGQPPTGEDQRHPPPTPTTAPPTTAPETTAVPTTTAAPAPTTTAAPAPPRSLAQRGVDLIPYALAGAGLLGVAGLVALVGTAATRRRGRRRNDPDPDRAVHGAWVEALDALRVTGFSPPPAWTPREIAARAPAPTGAEHSTALTALARVYTVVEYSPRGASGDDATAAWEAVDALDTELATRTTRWDRLRYRFDVRRVLGR